MSRKNRNLENDLSFEQIENEAIENQLEAIQVVENAEKGNEVKDLTKKIDDLTKMVEALVNEKLLKDEEIERLKTLSKLNFSLEQIKEILEHKQDLINTQNQFITVLDTLENIFIPKTDVDLNNEHFQLVLCKYDHSRSAKDVLFSINKNLVIDSAIQHMKYKIEERINDLTVEINNVEKMY